MRELLALEAGGDEAATLALAMFVRRAAECIAAAATSLPVLDAIVFTGGIGENAAGHASADRGPAGFDRRGADR